MIDDMLESIIGYIGEFLQANRCVFGLSVKIWDRTLAREYGMCHQPLIQLPGSFLIENFKELWLKPNYG